MAADCNDFGYAIGAMSYGRAKYSGVNQNTLTRVLVFQDRIPILVPQSETSMVWVLLYFFPSMSYSLSVRQGRKRRFRNVRNKSVQIIYHSRVSHQGK